MVKVVIIWFCAALFKFAPKFLRKVGRRFADFRIIAKQNMDYVSLDPCRLPMLFSVHGTK